MCNKETLLLGNYFGSYIEKKSLFYLRIPGSGFRIGSLTLKNLDGCRHGTGTYLPAYLKPKFIIYVPEVKYKW